MKRIFIVLLLLTTTAYAQPKVGIMGSLLYNVPDTDLDDSDAVDEESKAGVGLGMRALVPLTNNLFLRSGAGLVQKNYSYELTLLGQKGSADFTFLYLNIPATLYFSGMDSKLGIFFGTAINAKLADDCDGSGFVDTCEAVDEKSLVLPVVLGFDVVMNEKFSLELSYEHGVMETAEDVKVSSAVLSIIYNL